jgi:GNAT superfamily N-acetyltransferase
VVTAGIVEFRAERADQEPGVGLLRAMAVEIAAVYDGLDLNSADMPRAGADDLAPPGGAFLVGRRDGVAVCCGGVKRLPDGAAEIKRMFVVPEARRQGLARLLLGALEDAARSLGYDVVRLDTGPRQPHAQALYEASGYHPIGNFNANPVASFWGEKQLRPAAAP